MFSFGRTLTRCAECGIRTRFLNKSSNVIIGSTRFFSESVCQKTDKEMIVAFQEMQQAENLMKRRVFVEAEQLYSRTNDIVSSFSPANSPMIDVINRKKLQLYFYSDRITDAVNLMKTMKSNVDSRDDKFDAIAERIEFANILLHMGNTTESGIYCRELDKLCEGSHTPLSLSASLISLLQRHLTGEENTHSALQSMINLSLPLSPIWEVRLINNMVGTMWDDDVDVDATIQLCIKCKSIVEKINISGLSSDCFNDVRQALNNCGSFLISQKKIDEGGIVLKHSLSLSDKYGININENITSSMTLASIASVVLKQDQPVACEGLYLQALEAFTRKEKLETLNGFTLPEIYDYSKVCDGYAQLLLKWEKREPLGMKYQQHAVDLMMKLNEKSDWIFPLTSRFWTPKLFGWGNDLFCVCFI